jgi:hypothetical protein
MEREAFHWILESWLGWNLLLYLDDFIRFIPQIHATPEFLHTSNASFCLLAYALGIPINQSKKTSATTAIMLGIEIDTIRMEARLSHQKLQKDPGNRSNTSEIKDIPL